MKTKFLSSLLLFILITACAPNIYRVEPIIVVLRKQIDNSLIVRYFPPQRIVTANGEIVSFRLVVKNLKTNEPVKGVLIKSNLVDAVNKVSRSDNEGFVVFNEPIGVAEGFINKKRTSRYGKITFERNAYPRFWAINKKGKRISEKLEIPIRILKKEEKR